MPKEYITAHDIYLGVKKGTERLIEKKDEINALNVFPVPDGDTGSNMVSTMLEACKWMDKLKDKNNMKLLMKAFRDGVLMGARGNSGVILSQIVRGFSEYLENITKVYVVDFIEALKKAKEVAYHAVIKPVEGTMLTLIRRLAERSEKELKSIVDFETFMNRLVNISFEIVEETPKYLDKLRQAGVVDAGAKGLAYIFEGFKEVFREDIEVDLIKLENVEAEELPKIAYEELTYQYCTEAIVKLNKNYSKEQIDNLRSYLEEIGDSIVLVHQEDLLKCHVHTNHPGLVFEEFLKYGELYKVKVDNMKIQHEHVVESAQTQQQEEEFTVISEGEAKEKKWGIIAVTPGEGLAKIFKSLGADEIIKGGQTMNPSVKDFKEAIDKVNKKYIIILPNNSNIILSAKQAAEMYKDKEIIVVPTRYIQEGISVLLYIEDEMSPEEVKDAAENALTSVVPIQVTYAVRDSKIDNENIKKGEYLVFVEKNLKSHNKDLKKAVVSVLEELLEEGYEMLTIYYGKGMSESNVLKIIDPIMKKYKDVEVEIHEGGQEHYPLLISLE